MLLSEYKTKELVEELQKREGVKVRQTGVRSSVKIRPDEPAIVLVVKSGEVNDKHCWDTLVSRTSLKHGYHGSFCVKNGDNLYCKTFDKSCIDSISINSILWV